MKTCTRAKIFSCDVEKLYHATVINDGKQKEKYDELIDVYPDFTVPAIGEYSTRLDIEKWFSLRPCKAYISSLESEYVMLEYNVTKCPLRLAATPFASGNPHVRKLRRRKKIDGYFFFADILEVCLFSAEDCVDDEPSIVTPKEDPVETFAFEEVSLLHVIDVEPLFPKD